MKDIRTVCTAVLMTGGVLLALAGCDKNGVPKPITAFAAPADPSAAAGKAHGDPGMPKSTPNATGGTTEATGDNISTGSANGVPNAGAANTGVQAGAPPAK
ncbi:MAG TPA: hypothetical protein VGP06_05685 [Janthinobacterium sp.]|jgi:hypothetical protein|nr:hypothetical protein [Janthinobacterium sp.]